MKDHPPYYRDVLIYYQRPDDKNTIYTVKAWLAVNDDLELIWTRSDNEWIVPNNWVIKWEML